MRGASPGDTTTNIPSPMLNTRYISPSAMSPSRISSAKIGGVGQTPLRIFAPHPTSGAFGAIMSLPPLWTGYSGGSLQYQDTRFATSVSELGKARWESGHGVEPDAVVVEKLSDALNGIDTLLTVATAWLSEQ